MFSLQRPSEGTEVAARSQTTTSACRQTHTSAYNSHGAYYIYSHGAKGSVDSTYRQPLGLQSKSC